MAMEGGREGHAALARSLSLLALKYYVHKRARELHSFHQKHHSLQQLQQQQQIMSLVPLANRQELLGRCWASMPLRPIHFVTSPATPRWIHERNSAGALVGRAKCSLLAFSNMALSLSYVISFQVLTSGKLLTPIFCSFHLTCGGNGHSRVGSAVVPPPSSSVRPPSSFLLQR